jgi:hypothetical protein
MNGILSPYDLVELGGGVFVARLILADALIRAGDLIDIGGGVFMPRPALADSLIRAGYLRADGSMA